MPLYELICKTCKVSAALCATSVDELLRPDYETVAEQAGFVNADRLLQFNQEHQTHDLETAEVH